MQGMTSKLNHGDGSHGDSSSKPIHFFRIILPHTLLQGKLRIPEKFVKKYGKHLSNTMFLKLPNGAEWKVNLVKHDASIWFEKGWKEFVEYHSLAHGHLLVFRYDGTSYFHVLICDLSTMEIDYPVVDRKRTNSSEEIQPSTIRKKIGNNKDESNSNLQDTGFHHIGRDYKGKTSFKVIIKPCHFTNWYMSLPKDSLKGYIKPGGQNVMLLVGDKSWKVNLIHYQNKSLSFFSAGWTAFARENKLKKGDACLFQLLNNSDDMVIKVSISKRSSVKP